MSDGRRRSANALWRMLRQDYVRAYWTVHKLMRRRETLLKLERQLKSSSLRGDAKNALRTVERMIETRLGEL